MPNLVPTDADAVSVTYLADHATAAPCSEAIAIGNLIKLTAAGEWELANATDAASAGQRTLHVATATREPGQTLDGVRLGSIVYFDDALDALDVGDVVYLSDTDGTLSDTAGTVSVIVGTVVPIFGDASTVNKALRLDN